MVWAFPLPPATGGFPCGLGRRPRCRLPPRPLAAVRRPCAPAGLFPPVGRAQASVAPNAWQRIPAPFVKSLAPTQHALSCNQNVHRSRRRNCQISTILAWGFCQAPGRTARRARARCRPTRADRHRADRYRGLWPRLEGGPPPQSGGAPNRIAALSRPNRH
jgi:hypothetical protein